MDRRLSSPYNPLGKAANEAFVGITKRTLVKQLQGKESDWDLFISSVMYYMNNKYSRLHKDRPFKVMFNRRANSFKGYSNETFILDQKPASANEI
jgi:hypothetical protein